MTTPHKKKENKKIVPKKEESHETSWGSVASWYNTHLEKSGDTYHTKVVYPNILRLLGDVRKKHVLDLACGQGQFSRLLVEGGAFVIGCDIGKELIAIAEKHNKDTQFKAHFFTTLSHDLFMVKNQTQDYVVCILALQNIEKLQDTLTEIARVLKNDGAAYIVLNHPAFRNPTHTHWGYDDHTRTQYRRIDEYMSESKVKIDMTPGSETKKQYTVSFHRPLQVYSKACAKAGLAITRIEEWVSHKESEVGPRQKAENASRKEIPLFMCLELRPYSSKTL